MVRLPKPLTLRWVLPRRRPRGYTLIELLVAVGILALMAVLSWRGLDGMSQTQSRLQQRADAVLALQAGLAQWGADLDAMLVLPNLTALDWDGRALRLTRRTTMASAATMASASGTSATAASGSAGLGGADEAVLVVAWSRRDIDGTSQWLRWQSAPLQTRSDVQLAWAQAAQWAQNPGDDLKAREVRVVPLAQWQVFYFRGDAWTNPLSAAGNPAGNGAAGGAAGGAASATGADSGAAPSVTGSVTSAVNSPVAGGASGLGGIGGAVGVGGLAGALARGVAALAAGLPGTTGTIDTSVPQGVRLVLTLPPGQAISGILTRDWVLPTLGGGKS